MESRNTVSSFHVLTCGLALQKLCSPPIHVHRASSIRAKPRNIYAVLRKTETGANKQILAKNGSFTEKNRKTGAGEGVGSGLVFGFIRGYIIINRSLVI